jgi:hypothetical protein
MKAAKCGAHRERVVILNEAFADAELFEFLLVITLEEKSASVRVDIGLNQEHVRQSGFQASHTSSSKDK